MPTVASQSRVSFWRESLAGGPVRGNGFDPAGRTPPKTIESLAAILRRLFAAVAAYRLFLIPSESLIFDGFTHTRFPDSGGAHG